MRFIKEIAFFLLLVLMAPDANSQIQLLNDEFSDSSTLAANWININELESWEAEQIETLDINESSSGHMLMMPYTNGWYQDYKGTLIHKNISGDFVVTIEVTAQNRAQNDIPGSQYSLAGVMLRSPVVYTTDGPTDWVPDAENYVFLSCGFAAENHPTCPGCLGPHFEVKNTVNGTSTLQVSSISGSDEVLIRIARIDNAVLVLYKLPAESWVVRERYDRSDFPDTIQVGLVSYTDWQKVRTYTPYFHNTHVLNDSLDPDPSSQPGRAFDPDLVATFDFARFDSVYVTDSLIGVDLVLEATSEEILGFLSYDTEIFCPDSIMVSSPILEGQIAEMNAMQLITVNNQVDSLSSLHLVAGNSVEFLSGFQIDLGAVMEVEIEGCQ